MRRTLLLAALLMLAAAGLAAPRAGAADAGDGFVAGVEDLPLMPGLTPIESANLAFDSPSGRIVEAYAAGAVTRAQVLSFYARSLPQLGWVAERQSLFRRKGEELHLDFLGSGAPLTVRFTLSPQ